MTDVPVPGAVLADFDAYMRAVDAVFAADHARYMGWVPRLDVDAYGALAYAIECYEREHLEEVLADRPPRPPFPMPDDAPIARRRQAWGATAVPGTGVAEWDEWFYVPDVGVGPLRFGMTVEEVVEAAAGMLGRTGVGECVRGHAAFSPTWWIEVRRHEPAPSPPAVTAYVSRDAGLFCVAVDAVHGPRVAHDQLALVGRDREELESDAIAYAEARGVYLRYSLEGFAGPDDSGIVLCGQTVGQVLRSRPLFMVTREGANTEWHSIPSEEYPGSGHSTA
ncbi:hypothetical protein [Embleya hyalina]|uniref:hypothetical protein n=1 Tax=Embleya hyalina TaxID=516124 RepID=UPI000F83BFD2|nr:hypothetical protein [Embleya hyalina]